MPLWTIAPNWNRSVQVSYEFLTEIIVSRAGKEQRRALRQTPRRQMAYSSLMVNALFGVANRLLAQLRAAPMDLPDFQAGVSTTSSMVPGQDSVSVADVPAWLIDGAEVALYRGQAVEARTVESVVGALVTFAEVSTSDWPSGAKVCPLLQGRPAPQMRSTRHTNMHATLDVALEVLPASEDALSDEFDVSAWLNGREVFMGRPNWTTEPTVSYLNPVEILDYSTGPVAYSQAIDFNSRTFEAVFLQRNAAEAAILVQFFCRMRGRRGEFYLPTWESDMTFSADAPTGATILTVAGRELYDAHNDDRTMRAIAVTMRSGQVRFFALQDITMLSDTTRLHLMYGLVDPLLLADIRMVSWMPVTRLASDSLTVEWMTDELAQTVMTFHTLRDEPAEAPPGMTGATDYMLSTYGWEFTRDVFVNPLHWAMNVRLPEIFA